MKISIATILFLFLNIASFGQNQPKEKRENFAGAIAIANTIGFGGGAYFEHFWDNKQKWSFGSKIYLTSILIEKTRYSQYGHNRYNEKIGMFFIEPTLKYYPNGINGIARSAFGLNVQFGYANEGGEKYSGINFTDKVGRTIFGLILTYNYNFLIAKKIRFGVDMGLGFGADNGLRAPFGPGFNGLATFGCHLGLKFK